MMGEVSEMGFPNWVWLAALFMSLACVGILLAALWRRSFAAHLWLMRGTKAYMLAFLALAGADLLGDQTPLAISDWKPWWKLAEVGVLIASAIAVVSSASWVGSVRFWRQWGQPGTLLVIAIGMSAFARWRMEKPLLDQVAQTKRFMESLSDVRHTEIHSEGFFAETDAGRQIALERLVTIGEQDDKENDSDTSIPEGFAARVIVESEVDSPANCHGWVFTAGRYLIRGRFVDVILRDNKYRVVTAPVPGDLIVYRDEQGNPIHSGIVKAVGDEGFVLIESKWGALDACLHLPNDQVYSRSYAYYRSSREGHLLNGLPPGT